MQELGLGPADLGLLTAVYFLAMAAVQIPLGIMLDRYGPRRVQSACLVFAAAGSALFAWTASMPGLMVGRALIGLGFAAALMASLKAIVLWLPKERIALANGWVVMLGALGAVTATLPAESLVALLGWRGLFLLLAAATGYPPSSSSSPCPLRRLNRSPAHPESSCVISTATPASCGSHRYRRSASARPDRCRVCGPHRGWNTSKVSTGRPWCVISCSWEWPSASALCCSAGAPIAFVGAASCVRQSSRQSPSPSLPLSSP